MLSVLSGAKPNFVGGAVQGVRFERSPCISFRDVDAPLSIQINKGEELKSPGLFSRGLHVLGSASASLKAVSDWSRPGLDRL